MTLVSGETRRVRPRPPRRHRRPARRARSSSAPARRPGPSSSATSSAAARPTAFDRWLATRFGLHAIDAVAEKRLRHHGRPARHRHRPGPAHRGHRRAQAGQPRGVRRGRRSSSADGRRASGRVGAAVRAVALGRRTRSVPRTLEPVTHPRPRRPCTPSARPAADVPRRRRGRRRRRAPAHACRRWSSPASATSSRTKIAAVARGEAFLLQGGDCAETFDGVTADNVRNKLRVLLQMAVVLTYAASVPVVKVGRIAGQYAKPRSSDLETRDGVTPAGLPRRRGQRLRLHRRGPASRTRSGCVEVYNASAATLNLVRAFVTGGYADLRQVHTWNTDFVRSSPVGQRYEELAGEIDRALTFMQAIGADPDEFHRVDFHSSHEALMLEYEHALTRIDSRTAAAVRRVGPLRVDRRAHPPARRRARRAAPPHPQPDRRQARPDHDRRRRARAGRAAQPGQRAGPAHLHHPHGRRQDPRRPADAGREGRRRRRRGRLGLRPDARQHLRGVARATRPAASTT